MPQQNSFQYNQVGQIVTNWRENVLICIPRDTKPQIAFLGTASFNSTLIL